MSSKHETEWWHDFFVDFRPVFSGMPAKDTNALVRYIISQLKLKRGSTFLDCPCGIGRVAIPLAAKGIKVTGVDIMPSYLEEMELRAKRRGLPVKAVHADMRRIDFHDQFDAAANLRTSFGYFESESDNLRVLKKVVQALRSGGRFMMTLTNRDWIIANFQKTDWCEFGDLKVLKERSFDYHRSILTSHWHFIMNGQEKAHTVNLRLYSYHELLGLFRSAGFVEVRGYGSLKNEEVSAGTQTLVIIGIKP